MIEVVDSGIPVLIDRISNKYIIQITDIDIKSKSNTNVLVQGSYKSKYIPSVNTMYLINDSRKILDPKVREDRNNIMRHLQSSGYDRNCIPEDCKLIIEFGFYVNHGINSRDLDNMIKSNLDLLSNYFKFNDNRVYEISCYKRLILNSEKELVHFRIKKSEYNANNKIDYRLISED